MPDWDTDWLRTVAKRGYTTIYDKPASSLLSEAAGEIDRLRAGLELIKEAGMIHGPGWCVAQARGYLEDLDFDQFPENGKTA